VILDGAVDELVANMTGASDLRAEALQTKIAELSVTGAGDARVAVSDTLKVSITGAGKVEYIGNPPHIEREITGAGSIPEARESRIITSSSRAESRDPRKLPLSFRNGIPRLRSG